MNWFQKLFMQKRLQEADKKKSIRKELDRRIYGGPVHRGSEEGYYPRFIPPNDQLWPDDIARSVPSHQYEYGGSSGGGGGATSSWDTPIINDTPGVFDNPSTEGPSFSDSTLYDNDDSGSSDSGGDSGGDGGGGGDD